MITLANFIVLVSLIVAWLFVSVPVEEVNKNLAKVMRWLSLWTFVVMTVVIFF